VRRILSVIALVLLVGALTPEAGIPIARADTATAKPLLLPGKTTLYQRVLTRPGAMLVAKPGAAGGAAVPPLSIFYVYGRDKDASGKEFVQVGANAAGLLSGWISADQTIEWKQSLVLSFANRAGRDRVLFFANEKQMLDLAEADDAAARVAALRKEIAATGKTADGTVIAEEPAQYVDIRKQFYLLPILQAHEAMLASGFRVNSVEVASVTAGSETQPPVQSERVDTTLKNFSAAMVFVIDATASMGPYIDAARQVIVSVTGRPNGRSAAPSPITITVITASSSRRTRSDASHSPSPVSGDRVPSTGHSGTWIPPLSTTCSAAPRHSTCRTSSSAHSTYRASPSRSRSPAASRGHQTRTASSPSGSPPAAYAASARRRFAGSSARIRSATVSRPAAARCSSLTYGSEKAISSPHDVMVRTANGSASVFPPICKSIIRNVRGWLSFRP